MPVFSNSYSLLYMRIFYCWLLACCWVLPLGAQVVTVNGTVTDAAKMQPMAGVSVQAGRQFGTVTNKQGEFSLTVSESVLQKSGLRFTYIGYQPASLPYKSGQRSYSVALATAADSLAEVVISPKGLNLLRKAIEAIPRNYPDKPFVVTGVGRTYNVMNDSDYYFVNTGILESYYFPIAQRKAPETRLLQSEDTLVRNERSKEIVVFDMLRWLGAFHISDFLYGKSSYFDLEKPADFSFFYRRIDTLDGYTVHRIDFENRKGVERSGTVYLDTASLAFVGVDMTMYNLARPGSVTVDVSVSEYRYEKRGNWWYPKSFDANQKFKFGGRGQYIVAYHSLAIDDTPGKSFGYGETIQHGDENKTVVRQVPREAWEPYRERIRQLEQADYLPILETPYLAETIAADTTPVVKYKLAFSNRLSNYLFSEKVNMLVGMQSAAAVPSFPATGPAAGTDALRVQYLLGYRFQTLPRTFLQVQFGSNFGIGGVRSGSTLWALAYDIRFNKRYRPMTLAPLAGLHTQRLRHKDPDLKMRHRSWAVGLHWRIEQSRRKHWFVQGLYRLRTDGTAEFSQFSATPTQWTVSAGLFLR